MFELYTKYLFSVIYFQIRIFRNYFFLKKVLDTRNFLSYTIYKLKDRALRSYEASR